MRVKVLYNFNRYKVLNINWLMSDKASRHPPAAKQTAFLEVSCQYPEKMKIHLVKCHLNTHINIILCPESKNIT